MYYFKLKYIYIYIHTRSKKFWPQKYIYPPFCRRCFPCITDLQSNKLFSKMNNRMPDLWPCVIEDRCCSFLYARHDFMHYKMADIYILLGQNFLDSVYKFIIYIDIQVSHISTSPKLKITNPSSYSFSDVPQGMHGSQFAWGWNEIKRQSFW